jgi:chondroitin synthase
MYIAQLDSDDLLKRNAVETLVSYLDRNDVGCVYGSTELIDAEGKYMGPGFNWPEFSRERMMVSMIGHHFRMFRRRDWMRTEGFSEDLLNAVDYDMMLKLSEVCTLVHIDKVLYSYRLHGLNTSLVSKDEQDINDRIAVERALERMGLAELWEVYTPDPAWPRRKAYRRKGLSGEVLGG